MIVILKNVVNIKIKYDEEKREILIDGKAIRSTNNNTNAEKALQIVTALNIQNNIVAADAIHTKKETAEKIIEKKGDYILQVKLNQRRLYENIELYFNKRIADSNSKNVFVNVLANAISFE